MTVSEYAKYVVSNMNRATLGNALNIVKKFERIEKINDDLIYG